MIGLIETCWSAYFSSDHEDVAAFSILAATLIFRPSGLFGRPDAASRFDLRGSLRGAATAALLMLELSLPVLAHRVNANFSNELVLGGRWSAVAIVVAATFILRFLTLVFSATTGGQLRREPFHRDGLHLL
jgi:Domain of unknown function (DUF3382)